MPGVACEPGSTDLSFWLCRYTARNSWIIRLKGPENAETVKSNWNRSSRNWLKSINIVHVDLVSQAKNVRGPTWSQEFRSKMLARANIVYMDPMSEAIFGENICLENFRGQHVFGNLGQKCWRGPTSFTWTPWMSRKFFWGQHVFRYFGPNVGAGQHFQHIPS